MSLHILSQSGWMGFPSGQEKVAMEIALSKAEIERLYGLAFISGSDSLGNLDSTYFIDDVLGPVAIACYQRAPTGMAIVFIDSKLELGAAIGRLLTVFGLDASRVNVPAFPLSEHKGS